VVSTVTPILLEVLAEVGLKVADTPVGKALLTGVPVREKPTDVL